MKTPFVFDIKRASTSDGPGIRTVVFFKGCNLDCFWCHNPEGKTPSPQMALFREKCISCGACKAACEKQGLPCAVCGRCAEVCPTGARRLYGRKCASDELFEFIRADKPYFDATEGGVTFSGGECMLYPEYLRELAKQCAESGISVAVDTAGCVPYTHFETVLPYVDLFLYDVKCLDPVLHKKGTGRDNALILNNLKLLRQAEKRILVRIPVIPSFNDGNELERIEGFCQKNGLPFELLPYHELGDDKKKALRIE